jgi:hypothetical protein
MDQRGKTPDRQNSHRGHGCLSLVSVVCCQVEVSATGWSRGFLPSVVCLKKCDRETMKNEAV